MATRMLITVLFCDSDGFFPEFQVFGDRLLELCRRAAHGVDADLVETPHEARVLAAERDLARDPIDDLARRGRRRHVAVPRPGAKTGEPLLGHRGHVGQLASSRLAGSGEDAYLAACAGMRNQL